MGKEKPIKSKSSKTSSKASDSSSKRKSTREKIISQDESTKKSKRKHSPSPATPEKTPKIQETEGLLYLFLYIFFIQIGYICNINFRRYLETLFYFKHLPCLINYLLNFCDNNINQFVVLATKA